MHTGYVVQMKFPCNLEDGAHQSFICNIVAACDSRLGSSHEERAVISSIADLYPGLGVYRYQISGKACQIFQKCS